MGCQLYDFGIRSFGNIYVAAGIAASIFDHSNPNDPRYA